MPCNLDSTEYTRSFRTKPNPAWSRKTPRSQTGSLRVDPPSGFNNYVWESLWRINLIKRSKNVKFERYWDLGFPWRPREGEGTLIQVHFEPKKRIWLIGASKRRIFENSDFKKLHYTYALERLLSLKRYRLSLYFCCLLGIHWLSIGAPLGSSPTIHGTSLGLRCVMAVPVNKTKQDKWLMARSTASAR